MKFISALLIIHILFLALAPGLNLSMASGMKHGKHSCCETAKNEQNCPKDQKDKGCNNGCNPFMSCCNGFALTSPSIQLSFHLISTADQKFVLQKQNLSTAYLAAAWHPPKNYPVS